MANTADLGIQQLGSHQVVDIKDNCLALCQSYEFLLNALQSMHESHDELNDANWCGLRNCVEQLKMQQTGLLEQLDFLQQGMVK